MDYCNNDSEIIDSLDYLRPPVKRNINSNRERTFDNNCNEQPNILYCKLTKRGTQKVNQTLVESSTSLILKKTSELEILKKYPIVSNAAQKIIVKDKPLIKVTVITKGDEAQRKIIKKLKPVKRVHSAVSNQESYIKTKNVYLVVAGRKREKVYEIKTTGSAKLSNDHTDCCFNDVKPLEQLSNYKEFIDSLNMDKKRKKSKKRKQKGDLCKDDNIQDDGDMFHECPCIEAARDNLRTNVRSPRSRVTIVGRVGVTEDERYVLNYAATINNEPVTVNCSPAGFNLLPFNLGNNQDKQKIPTNNKSFGCVNECINDVYGCYACNKYQRDSNVQADYPDDNTCYKLMDRNTLRNKESKGTQVNLNINLSNVKTREFESKVCRYDLCDCDRKANLPDNRNETNNLKECQSPLVIISVYPKKDLSDIAQTIICSSEGNACKSLLQRTQEYTGYNINNAQNNVECKTGNAKKTYRISRSPSPATKNDSKTKLEDNKQLDPRFRKANVRKESPSGRLSNVNQIIQKNTASQKCKARKTKLHVNESNGETIKRQDTVTKHTLIMKSQDTKGTNTEHLLAKKALVDSYTKSIASQMKWNGKTILNNGVSNIEINIESENDDYDVLFYQDNCTTDLNIRKTGKKEMSQKCCGGHTNLVQNLLQTTRQKSKKWPFFNDQSHDDLPITNHMSRLNLKDSLEIVHRRDDKITNKIKDTQTSEYSKVKNLNSNDMKFLAPIKHYAGDKCSVPDPLVRDKEIRVLLGIEKCKATTSKAQDTQERHGNNEQVPEQCKQEECNRGPFDNETNKVESRCKFCNKIAKRNKHGDGPRDVTKSTSTQYEPQAIDRTYLYQQMILKRNIQVFLQVERFRKQKPIILSRKQYNKVKRTIQDTITKSQERRRSKCIYKDSIVSVSEVRRKSKQKCLNDKTSQTEPQDLKTDCYVKEEEPTCCIGLSTSRQPGVEPLQFLTVDSQNEQHVVPACSEEQNKDKTIRNEVTRKTVSSMEICYTNVAYFKHVTFSSTNIDTLFTPPDIASRNSSSIQTIFKGRRNSPTPNLGTSAFSLISEMGDSKSVNVLMYPRESKPKKPFLRRLMSCLVMRTMRASEAKMGALPSPPALSVNSTVDSYHISTSLGAIELSSSIYDTSASFYSNHSIHPMSNKMKRGFLSSVREYLMNRKS